LISGYGEVVLHLTRVRNRSGLLILAFVLLWTGMVALGAGFDTEPAGAQVTPLEDEPDESPTLGRITGSPDPGPAPEDAGDRGGAIQLGLAVVLFSGLVFIALRIRAEIKRNRDRGPSESPEHSQSDQ